MGTTIRYARVVLAAAAFSIGAGACTSVTPTTAPAPSPSPSASQATLTATPRPTIAGPAWVQAAADRWFPGSPEWEALSQPDVPYHVGGSAFGNPNGITFTPAIARRWWDAWIAHPVDRRSIPAGLQPGGLVLSADELKQVTELDVGKLPPAPAGYNPLGLPVIP